MTALAQSADCGALHGQDVATVVLLRRLTDATRQMVRVTERTAAIADKAAAELEGLRSALARSSSMLAHAESSSPD